MSIICGSLTEEDNPLSPCAHLIPNLNLPSKFKLRFFRDEFVLSE